MKQRKRKSCKLWVYFALIHFTIMSATAVIVSCLAVLLFHFGHLTRGGGNPLAPILFLLGFSVLVGTVISMFVSNKILQPITLLSKAAKEVGKGNFDVQVMEREGVEEIQHLTHNFNRMAQELASIETLRNDFVVNVSHEFKTPIAAIEGYAMLLQDGSITDIERNEYTQMIIDSSRQLSTLSGNILSLSKLENQEVLLEQTSFRLDEQIRQVVLLLEPEWSNKELDLQIDLEKVTYYSNEKLLFQVWMNLIGNAIKFTPPGGEIVLSLILNENQVVIKISDTGCGMSEAVRKHIFDKFYQGDTARKAEGNGLGLALVKRIVELFNGEIHVDSKNKKGSIFTVILPQNNN